MAYRDVVLFAHAGDRFTDGTRLNRLTKPIVIEK